MPNLWLIFTTGLIAGGLTCAAVQGGLLATTIAQQPNSDPKRTNIIPILSFLVAKLIAYTILGFFLGWLGSFFQFSLSVQAILLTVVAIFMVGTALSFLDVHPIFRHFIIQPPRFLTRLIWKQTKKDSARLPAGKQVFAPAMLGASTLFIPCGTTQAMMALAIASGNPFAGALTLSTFVVGTFPVFFFLGYSIEWLKDTLRQRFVPVAAYTILGMALWNVNGAAVLWGSPMTLQSMASNFYCTITFCDSSRSLSGVLPTTDVTIYIGSKGYSIDNPVIPAGVPITLRLINEEGRGCTQAFTIPRLGIQRIVPLGQSATVTFTAPRDASELSFTCSMGMYGGKFTIVGGGT